MSLHDELLGRFTRLASAAIAADDLRQRTDQRDFSLVGPLAGRAYAAGRDVVRQHPPSAPTYFPDYAGAARAALQLSNANSNPDAPAPSPAVSDPPPHPRRPAVQPPVAITGGTAPSGNPTLRAAREAWEIDWLKAQLARHGGNTEPHCYGDRHGAMRADAEAQNPGHRSSALSTQRHTLKCSDFRRSAPQITASGQHQRSIWRPLPRSSARRRQSVRRPRTRYGTQHWPPS